jgi:hypothetical protein
MIVQFDTAEGTVLSDPLEWSHLMEVKSNKKDKVIRVFYKNGLHSDVIKVTMQVMEQTWQEAMNESLQSALSGLVDPEGDEGELEGAPEAAQGNDNLLVTGDGSVITPEEFEILNNPACKVHQSRQFYAQKNKKRRAK